jgi:hypothetical protein
MSIIVLDPTPGTAPRAARLAPALATLAGTRIALLDNGKKNVRSFLDHVDDLLRTNYGVRDVVRVRKPSQNAPAPPELIAELARADAAVSAVGD